MSKLIHLNGKSERVSDDLDLERAAFSEIDRDTAGMRSGGQFGATGVTLDAAREEARRIRDDAYREGYEAGRTEAADNVSHEAGRLLDALKDLNEKLRREERTMLAEMGPQVVQLAVGVAEKILHCELEQDGSTVRATVDAALRKLTERERVTIRANPADVELLKEFKIDVAKTFEDVNEVRVVADENITRGGCIVETDMLRVNGDIAAQLDEVRQQLME